MKSDNTQNVRMTQSNLFLHHVNQGKSGSADNSFLNRGFTLIEILISSAILIILASGLVALQFILGKNRVTAWVSYQTIEESNRALDSVVRELKNTAQSETGAYPLDTANDQEIIFYSDYDFDGTIERVRYTLSGLQLVRGVIEPSGNPASYVLSDEKMKVVSEIIRNGSDPVFYYYNNNWPTDTTNNPLILSSRISDTRHIRIILITNPVPDQPEFDYTVELAVSLRTLAN